MKNLQEFITEAVRRTRDDRDHDCGTHIGGDAEVIGKARIMRGEYLSGTYAEER